MSLAMAAVVGLISGRWLKAGAAGGWVLAVPSSARVAEQVACRCFVHRVCCRLHDDPRGPVRGDAGRDPETAAVIDSQAVRGASTVPPVGRAWGPG
jgi:hypothetical protein